MSSARQQADLLVELLRREHRALAEFLSALAAFDRTRGWAELGHASLFAFLVKDLGLSNGAAAYRKAAVELVQRFPEVLGHLRSGELCITTVFELSKVVTGENAHEVIPRFFGASRRDAKNVVAELAPEPAPQRTVVTAVLASLAPENLALSDGRPADHPRANSEPATQERRGAQGNLAAPRTVVEPKTAELSRVHVTVPRRLLEKLAAARDALSHSNPNATDAEVLEVGLDLIIERHRKRRGIGAKPRKPVVEPEATSAPKATAARGVTAVPAVTAALEVTPDAPPPPPRGRSRRVPAEVWRAVWARDGGHCVWPLENGGVCGSTHKLQLDHLDGWALGGATTVERCRILCERHNDRHARELYGDELMNRYTRPKGPRCSEAVARYVPSRSGRCSTWGAAAPRRRARDPRATTAALPSG
jgi:hypothetical protein